MFYNFIDQNEFNKPIFLNFALSCVVSEHEELPREIATVGCSNNDEDGIFKKYVYEIAKNYPLIPHMESKFRITRVQNECILNDLIYIGILDLQELWEYFEQLYDQWWNIWKRTPFVVPRFIHIGTYGSEVSHNFYVCRELLHENGCFTIAEDKN